MRLKTIMRCCFIANSELTVWDLANNNFYREELMGILPSHLKPEFKCNRCSNECEEQFSELEWGCIESHEWQMRPEHHCVATVEVV